MKRLIVSMLRASSSEIPGKQLCTWKFVDAGLKHRPDSVPHCSNNLSADSNHAVQALSSTSLSFKHVQALHTLMRCAESKRMDESSKQTKFQLQDSMQGCRLVYSSRCGRILLNNVTVQNRGVDWAHESNIYWQHKVRSWPDVNLAPYLLVRKRYPSAEVANWIQHMCMPCLTHTGLYCCLFLYMAQMQCQVMNNMA